MGTNFYWIINPETMKYYNYDNESFDDLDPIIHIGKRSCAGSYCEDCGVALSLNGTYSIDTSPMLDNCPVCGKSWRDVKGVCSFTWTMMKHKKTLELFANRYPHLEVCRDEYGTRFTALKMLDEADCVIQYQNASRFE